MIIANGQIASIVSMSGWTSRLTAFEEDIPGAELKGFTMTVSSLPQQLHQCTHETDNQRRTEAKPCGIRLEPRCVRQRLPIDALRLHTGIEPGVCEADTGPGDQAADGRKVGKPAEDHACSLRHAHVRQAAETGAEDDGNIRQAGLRRPRENLGSIATEGQAI